MRRALILVVMLVALPAFAGLTSRLFLEEASAQENARGPVQDLDEMFLRKARLEKNPWPYADLENAFTRLDWQPETLCFADTKTGHEVWRMTAAPNKNNYYHNDIAVSPWSADGRRMGLTSWRARRGGERRNLWMVVDTDGSRLRPTVNTPGYMHWSPLLPDVYYTFGGVRFMDVKSEGNVLYKVTVTDEGPATTMTPLITYPQPERGGYGNRKFISADGKMFVTMTSVSNPNWTRGANVPEYEMYFIPSIIFPEEQARPLLEKGYTVNREFGDYLARPYTKGRYHDAYLLGDGTYYYAIDREIGYWRIKTLGSAPDGGAKFTGDDGKHHFGEIIPEYVRKKGKRDDPWTENQYPGHPGFDRWGEMVNIANYDTVDEKGNFKIGCTVYDFINHRPVTGSWIPQTDGSVHCDWHAYADWCVVSVEKGEFSYGDARIECFPYDKRGENFIVCYTHNFLNGGKAYYNYIRPAQSPDGTKVAFHSDMLNSKASPDCYWAVCYYPKPPVNLKAAAAAEGGVKLTWEMPTYTTRGWPKKTDPPPPAREIKTFHVWRAPTPGGPWKEVGSLDVQYKVNVERAIMEATNLEFTDKAPDGTHYYAMTSEEYSRLESRELSEIIKVTVLGAGRTVTAEAGAKAGQADFYKQAPAPPWNVTARPSPTPGQVQLSWEEPNDRMVRYYNVYYSTTGAPIVQQKCRIASVPVGTKSYLDWLADPEKDGRYAVTSVDRQGNESTPARP